MATIRPTMSTFQTFGKYWANTKETVSFGHFNVKGLQSEEDGGVIQNKLSVSNTSQVGTSTFTLIHNRTKRYVLSPSNEYSYRHGSKFEF